jgi:flagellar basal body-associated protein FliL
VKRQIIKTKPVRPYRVARIIIIIIAVIVIIVIAAVGFEVWTRTHTTHALTARAAFALQDSSYASRNPPSPVVLR